MIVVHAKTLNSVWSVSKSNCSSCSWTSRLKFLAFPVCAILVVSWFEESITVTIKLLTALLICNELANIFFLKEIKKFSSPSITSWETTYHYCFLFFFLAVHVVDLHAVLKLVDVIEVFIFLFFTFRLIDFNKTKISWINFVLKILFLVISS